MPDPLLVVCRLQGWVLDRHQGPPDLVALVLVPLVAELDVAHGALFEREVVRPIFLIAGVTSR